jgi:hypothetical protein
MHTVSFRRVIWRNLLFFQNVGTPRKRAGGGRLFSARVIVVALEGLRTARSNKKGSLNCGHLAQLGRSERLATPSPARPLELYPTSGRAPSCVIIRSTDGLVRRHPRRSLPDSRRRTMAKIAIDWGAYDLKEKAHRAISEHRAQIDRERGPDPQSRLGHDRDEGSECR